jgi:hypothetical protein
VGHLPSRTVCLLAGRARERNRELDRYVYNLGSDLARYGDDLCITYASFARRECSRVVKVHLLVEQPEISQLGHRLVFIWQQYGCHAPIGLSYNPDRLIFQRLVTRHYPRAIQDGFIVGRRIVLIHVAEVALQVTAQKQAIELAGSRERFDRSRRGRERA